MVEAAIKALLIALTIAACGSFPATRIVTGVLTRVQHDESREAHCPFFARLKDAQICDVPPVCCAYKLTVKEASGKEWRFYAFWPKFAPGIYGLVPVGDSATFKLHQHEVREFPCSLYGCRSTMDYVLFSDDDVKPLR